MSKLAELLTEIARTKGQAVILDAHPSGEMIASLAGKYLYIASDEAELIAKLSEYLAKEKNQ